MKSFAILVLIAIVSNKLYGQFKFPENNGESLYRAILLNINRDSLTTVRLHNSNPLYLEYYSLIPSDVKLKVTTNRNARLIFHILRRISSSKVDSVQLNEFMLADSISTIELTALDDTRYMLIQNLDTTHKGETILTFDVVDNRTHPLKRLNIATKKHEFLLNKYSNSYFAQIEIDSTSIVNFNIPNNIKSKSLYFTLSIYDTSLHQVGILSIKNNLTQKTFSASLEKGVYYLRIENEQNQWPTDTLPDKISSIKQALLIERERLVPNPPNSIRLLSEWLKETGLSNYFQVKLYQSGLNSQDNLMIEEINKLYNRKKYMLGASRSLNKIKDTTERKKLEEVIWRDFEDKLDYSLFAQKPWYDKNNEPTYFLYLAPNLDKEDMSKLEFMYQKQFDTSFWFKIFDKIRLYANVPLEKIIIYVPIWCSMDWVYTISTKNGILIERFGFECQSGGASTLLVDLSKVNSLTSVEIIKKIDIGEKADFFLKKEKFKNTNATFEYLQRDKYSFSVVVRNVKGYILKGDDKWEKIEIKCFIREGENGKYLQVETDGVYANGLGTYPKDSQFDKSFEPRLKQNLIAFSENFITEFKTFLFK